MNPFCSARRFAFHIERICLIAAVLVAFRAVAPALENDRPNMLWLTAEDLSPALGCYGDRDAITPNIDRLAQKSIRYTHAFATSPVCSTSRACLINGLPAAMQGTHAMRSVFPIPASMNGFPTWLRRAGYYTSNNVKTDYNSANSSQIIKSSWDDSSQTAHWRNAKKGQPFFSVFNFMTSHQSRSMVWSFDQFQKEVQDKLEPHEIHDSTKVVIPPYYPDTPLVRKTVARFHDCVTVMDKQVGAILKQLEEDGHADNTIVFFYSDHGSGMPRHKRALLDTGMRVPLLIYLPDKYKAWAPSSRGSTSNRLVNFEDFAPTVLSLAGISSIPAHMTGQAFLGPLNAAPRKYVFGHRDRIDEIMDFARSVRDRRFLYVRNYMPHLGYNQQSAWIDQAQVRNDFYRLAESQTMTKPQRHFLAPTRAREELYDCDADPLNVNNLVDSAEYADELRRLRQAHSLRMVETKDLGFVPETELLNIANRTTPYEWARSGKKYPSPKLISAAELVGQNAFDRFHVLMDDDQPSVRYWSCVGLAAADAIPDPLVAKLERSLSDSSEIVCIESANALARHGHLDTALPVLSRLLDHENPTVVLHAARTVELLGTKAVRLYAKMKSLHDRMQEKTGDEAWFIEFSTSGYLRRVQQ